MNVLAIWRNRDHLKVETDDGDYSVLATDPEDLHRRAADEEHRAAVSAHRASVYRAAADMWEAQ